ncbi:glycosyltransferase family 39 protein [Longispora sp. K20-0274]|uniref:glycosyltransferase family 39 protein n=1 Tax=Longispora sp. K20-0274 TaxID=3088255 RepID=UPI00399BA491
MTDDTRVATAVATRPTEGGAAARTLGIPGRLVRGVWFWPAVVMAPLGLWRIGRPEMWQDELVTISVAVRSVRQIFALLPKVDAVHGFYYLFMHFWIRLFGDGAIAVRVPSALAMVGAAACVGLIGKRLFGHRAGVLGGLVFAIVPTITRFGQEARSYAFVVLAASLATLLLLRALERPTFARWAGYALSLTSIMLLNAVATTIVAGHAAAAVAMLWGQPGRRRRWGQFAVAATLGVLPALPVIYIGSTQATRQMSWIPDDHFWTVWPQTFGSTWLAWAVTLVAVPAFLLRRQSAVFGALVAVVPVVLVWLVSLGDLHYFFSKYLLFTLPAWAVLAGAGLAAARLRTATAAGLVLLAAAAVPGQLAMRERLSHAWYTYPSAPGMVARDYSGIAHIIADNYQPGDGVVYDRLKWWYLHDVAVRYYLPKNVKPRDVFLYITAAQDGELRSIECSAAVACMRPYPRVWLVTPDETDTPLETVSQDEKRALRPYATDRIWHTSGMTVTLLIMR